MEMKKTAAAVLSALFLMMNTASVKADGYWQDGYWDEASQTWVEGGWVETGGWNGGPRQEYVNGAVLNYDANGNWTGTVVSGVPVYAQGGGGWGGITVGEGGTMAATGCVPTAAAVILNHFGIGGSPLDMAYVMNSYGSYNSWNGHGADSGGLAALCGSYGLGGIAFADYDTMYRELQRGKLVAAFIGGNTDYTHCVVLYGLDPAGNTNVSDPKGNAYRTNIAGIVGNMSAKPMDWSAGGPFVSFGYEW